MGCCSKHGGTDGDCIQCLHDEIAELRGTLYDEQHGISFHMRDSILQRWQDHGRQLMASHRAQLPSEARDLYGGGCGCNQCEEVRALLTPNVRVEGPPEARSAGGNLQAQLAGGPSRTKGWASWSPVVSPPVGSVGVGGSFEKMRMYVEIIPREVADVVREAFKGIPKRRRLENDSIGFQTLHDAVINAEHVCASVLSEVEPQNLLFIFGQTVQSLSYAPIPAPPEPPLFDEGDSITGEGNGKQSASNNEGKPKHRAIVLCKLKHSDELEKHLAGKKKDGGHDTECYEIAWCELQELKKRFCGFSEHIERPNV